MENFPYSGQKPFAIEGKPPMVIVYDTLIEKTIGGKHTLCMAVLYTTNAEPVHQQEINLVSGDKMNLSAYAMHLEEFETAACKKLSPPPPVKYPAGFRELQEDFKGWLPF